MYIKSDENKLFLHVQTKLLPQLKSFLISSNAKLKLKDNVEAWNSVNIYIYIYEIKEKAAFRTSQRIINVLGFSDSRSDATMIVWGKASVERFR